jgi:cell division protease FtsH
MSRLGRVYYRQQSRAAFLSGSSLGEAECEYSEHTAREIDVEVHKILDDATDQVREVLRERRAALEAVAQRLIEKEVIDAAELRQLLQQHSPGPHLVPGSLAATAIEAPAENGAATVEENRKIV